MKIHCQRVALAHAEVWLYPGAFPPSEAEMYFLNLQGKLDWQERTIKLFGQQIKSPRLSVWYGSHSYTYSGLRWPARPLTHELIKIRENVEMLAGQEFNGVLCNLYRDGEDSMGWHSDNEPELGSDPVLASVVFGARRRFVFRKKKEKVQKKEVILGDGDVLLMGSGTQSNWQHSVLKTSKKVEARINLTFRRVI